MSNNELNLIDIGEEETKCIMNDILQRKTAILEAIEQLKMEIKETDDDLDGMEELDNVKSTEKELLVAIKNFNKKPKKGLSMLMEANLIDNSAYSVANFLYNNSEKGLSKTAIGEYLGDADKFHLEVLKEFVYMHNFKNKRLDEALRVFLWSFRLPGEAQKIDRMMEAFAEWYCTCNPGLFSNTDTCYILSFSVIMLNTSLHNPSAKSIKVTKESYIKMNQGIDDGKDVSSELQSQIFDSIKKNQFRVPDDDMDVSQFFNPDKEGWLLKQGGGRYKTWRRRWFVLEDNCLYYFEYTSDKEPKGIIPLENLQVRDVTDTKKHNCFEIFLPTDAVSDSIKRAKPDSEGKLFEANKHMSYRFSAPTPSEKDQWISFIRKSISNDPYYDIIAARKKSLIDREKKI